MLELNRGDLARSPTPGNAPCDIRMDPSGMYETVQVGKLRNDDSTDYTRLFAGRIGFGIVSRRD